MTDSKRGPETSGNATRGRIAKPLARLWEMATDEVYFTTYLLNPHPLNLDIVTRYAELLEERSAILRKMMEGQEGGATAPPSATATTPELLEYFIKSDLRMMALLRRIYGKTRPKEYRKE